ncbi:MAG: flavin reductase [Planctomycetaceae bacterium]|nr:flavin reductase [Planctomycetaceae bacterium]
MTESQRNELGAVLGRTPSGLFILTAKGPDGSQTGMLASWVQQAAFDPPAVTVAIKKGRYLHEWLSYCPAVALSLVGETQKKFLGHFGRGFEPHEPAFEGLDVRKAENGLPVLADALGWLEGNVAERLETGDHVVYLVNLTGGGCGPQLEAEKPWVHIRKNGFNY